MVDRLVAWTQSATLLRAVLRCHVVLLVARSGCCGSRSTTPSTPDEIGSCIAIIAALTHSLTTVQWLVERTLTVSCYFMCFCLLASSRVRQAEQMPLHAACYRGSSVAE